MNRDGAHAVLRFFYSSLSLAESFQPNMFKGLDISLDIWKLCRSPDKHAAPFYGSMLGLWQIMRHAILHRACKLNQILWIFVLWNSCSTHMHLLVSCFFLAMYLCTSLFWVLPKHCTAKRESHPSPFSDSPMDSQDSICHLFVICLGSTPAHATRLNSLQKENSLNRNVDYAPTVARFRQAQILY